MSKYIINYQEYEKYKKESEIIIYRAKNEVFYVISSNGEKIINNLYKFLNIIALVIKR